MSSQNLLTKSLKEVAQGVVFFPKQTLCAICGVSPSTLDRHRNDLIEVSVPGFNWEFYSLGYDFKAAECVWQYCQLVKLMRRERAKEVIKKHMEEVWNAQKNR